MCMLNSQLHTAAYGCKISLQSAIALLIEGLHIDIHCIDIGEQLKQLLLLYIAICNNDVFQPVLPCQLAAGKNKFKVDQRLIIRISDTDIAPLLLLQGDVHKLLRL